MYRYLFFSAQELDSTPEWAEYIRKLKELENYNAEENEVRL